MLPPMESSFFTYRVSQHNLRGRNMLVKPRYKKKKYGFRSLRFQGPSLWNNLPDNLRDESNHVRMKLLIDNWQPSCDCNSCPLCTLNSIYLINYMSKVKIY